MPVIPIDVPAESVLIRADRCLSFEVVSAFRSPTANLESIRVLDRWDDENRILAEFSSPVPLLFNRVWTLKTIEAVTFIDPERLEFELSEPTGILSLLEDRFVLEDVDGWTRFRYESRFGISGWIFGWVIGKLLFERMFKQHMRTHLDELKETIEARASRSRTYPMPESDPPESR